MPIAPIKFVWPLISSASVTPRPKRPFQTPVSQWVRFGSVRLDGHVSADDSFPSKLG